MSRERNIFPLRMDSETTEMAKVLYKQDNCSSQNEFIEKAVNFYISYITTNNHTSFLNPMLHEAVKASLKENENRMANNLFRLSVELSMMMNILASGLELTDEQLRNLRSRCTREIKKSKGKISLEDAIEYQRSDD